MIYRVKEMGGFGAGSQMIIIPPEPEKHILKRDDIKNTESVTEFQFNISEALARNQEGSMLNSRLDINEYYLGEKVFSPRATEIMQLLGSEDINLFKEMANDENFPTQKTHNDFIKRISSNSFDIKDVQEAVKYCIDYIHDDSKFADKNLQSHFQYWMSPKDRNTLH